MARGVPIDQTESQETFHVVGNCHSIGGLLKGRLRRHGEDTKTSFLLRSAALLQARNASVPLYCQYCRYYNTCYVQIRFVMWRAEMWRAEEWHVE